MSYNRNETSKLGYRSPSLSGIFNCKCNENFGNATSKFYTFYKYQKAGKIVFKYDLTYLGFSLNDLIIIIYTIHIHINNLKRCL